jgi:ribonuclease HI
MAKKFYVVWSGRKTGVFTDWATTHALVDKFPGARFKSFATHAEAESALRAGRDRSQVFKARAKSTAKRVLRKADASAEADVRVREADVEADSEPVGHGELDVRIYCDGACEPNPGNAGSGIAIYRHGVISQLWYGLHNPNGTNNTAELNALYHALLIAKREIHAGHSVEILSDSRYSINCVSVWAAGWEKKGWRKAGGDIKNLEIIQTSYVLYNSIKADVGLSHVAAHVGTEGNELADRMAMLAVLKREKELRLYEDEIDVRAILRMRAG